MKKVTTLLVLLLLINCASQQKGAHKAGTQRQDVRNLKAQLKKNPADPEAHYAIGLAYAEKDSDELAIAHYDTALSINPDMTKVKVQKGNLFIKKNRITEGYAEYLDVLKSKDGEDFTDEIARQLGQPYPIRQLTSDDYNNAFGRFSPEGNRIVYQSDRDGDWNIYLMDKDGKQAVNLTESRAHEEMPTFSFDGKRIVYTSTQDDTLATDRVDMQRNIYIMNMDDRNIKRAVSFKGDDWYPSFTNNDNEIVFTSEKDDPRNVSFQDKLSDIYLLDMKSGQVQRLTQNQADDGSPVVSRNGKWIYFTSNRDGNYQIYKMNINGGEISKLTDRNWNCGSPHLSHDEKRITFFAEVDGNFDIYIMNVDGEKLTRLTQSPAQDAYPCFSPDGKRIIFHSNQPGKFQIFWIDLLNPLSRQQIVNKLEQKILESD